jgi:type IV secretory pathway TraG/TraD family ATPase VirD4
MTPNDLDSAKYWSGMTAETTVTSSTQGKDHSFANPVIYQERRESESETGRPLMTAGEILQMPKGKMLLFHSGMPPARLDLLQYYRQQPWKGRAHL